MPAIADLGACAWLGSPGKGRNGNHIAHAVPPGGPGFYAQQRTFRPYAIIHPSASSMQPEPNAEILSGISPDRVAESYHSGKLEALSQAELFRAAAHIVSQPKLDLNSFRLHAPLEIMARYNLLPLVSTADLDLARIQIVATASHYQAGGEGVSPPERIRIARSSDAAANLRRAVQEGDVARADALCLSLAGAGGLQELLDAITDLTLRTLTGAAHTHIGLMLMTRMSSDVGHTALGLARAGVRSLAQAPGLNLKRVTIHRTLKDPETELASILRAVPVVSPQGPGMMAMMQATEQADLPDRLLGDALLSNADEVRCESALRTACRIAALSMLEDKPEPAKYYWTHCLTLPHAAWALTRFLPGRSFAAEAAHTAATWVMAIRASHGNGNLKPLPELERLEMDLTEALVHSPRAAASVAWFARQDERPRIERTIATEAAIRNDAHLVKYAWACLDAAAQDPTHAPLFHAAAAYLCAIWCIEQPRDGLVRKLGEGRG